MNMYRSNSGTQVLSQELHYPSNEQAQELSSWQKSYPPPPSQDHNGLLSPPLEQQDDGSNHVYSHQFVSAENYFPSPVYYNPQGPRPVSPPMYQIPSLPHQQQLIPGSPEFRHSTDEIHSTHLPSPTEPYFPNRPQQQQQQMRNASITPVSSYNTSAVDVPDFDVPCRPFISKLSYLLRNPTLYGDVICWDTFGTTFIIAPSEKLVDVVLPAIFSHKSAAAFTRQLTTYGFVHLTSSQLASRFEHSPDNSTPIRQLSAWSNPNFLRDDPSKMHKLIPKPSKARAQSSKDKAAAWMRKGADGEVWKPKGL